MNQPILKFITGVFLIIALISITQQREPVEIKDISLIEPVETPKITPVQKQEPISLIFNKTLPKSNCWYVPFYVEFITPNESLIKVRLNSSEQIRIYIAENAISSFNDCINSGLVENIADYNYTTFLERTYKVTKNNGIVIRAPKGGIISLIFEYK